MAVAVAVVVPAVVVPAVVVPAVVVPVILLVASEGVVMPIQSLWE